MNDYSTTTVNLSISGPADSRFQACQPSGWQYRKDFKFSPAVCPKGWTAYSVRSTSSEVERYSINRFSAAHCCSRYEKNPTLVVWIYYNDSLSNQVLCCNRYSGFSLSSISSFQIEGILSTARFQDITQTAVTLTSSSTQNLETTFLRPNGFRVHNAWQISWSPTDFSILNPVPPYIVCSTTTISTWVPGETVDPSLINGTCPARSNVPEHTSASAVSIYFFLVIGLPIVLFALLITCLITCCRANLIEESARTAGEGTEGATSLTNIINGRPLQRVQYG